MAENDHEDGESTASIGAPQKEDTIDREPVFHYSRERRLSRASPMVRALNEGAPIRPGLSRGFFAARGNVFVFGAIMLALSVFGLAHRFSNVNRGLTLGGNSLSVSISEEEGVLLLNIVKKAPRSGKAYTGAVDIAVSPVLQKQKDGLPEDIPPVFTHRVIFRPLEAESSSTSLPFEGSEFFIILRTIDEQKTLRLKAK